MNCTMAVKTEASEVFERVIRSIFVDMVNVYGHLTVRNLAYLASPTVALPSIQSSFSVVLQSPSAFFNRVNNALAFDLREIGRIAFHVVVSMFDAVKPRSVLARCSALNAHAFMTSLLARFFYSRRIALETVAAHCFPINSRCQTSNARAPILPFYGLNGIDVNSHEASDFFDASSCLLQERKNLHPINKGHDCILPERTVTGLGSESNVDRLGLRNEKHTQATGFERIIP